MAAKSSVHACCDITYDSVARLLIFVAVAVFGSDRGHAMELIRNGSFEEGLLDSGVMLDGWEDDAEGVNSRGLSIARYNPSAPQLFEYPPGVPTPPDFDAMIHPQGAGQFFGHRWGRGNGEGFFGSATQLIDLSRHQDHSFEFRAWLASRFGASDTDYAVVSLEFFSGPVASGESLGSIQFDGNDQQSPNIVGSLNLDGLADPTIPATQDNWTLYRSVGMIPSRALSGAVVIRSAGASPVGNGDDAYVDLVSLQIVPEPSAGAMLALSFLALAVLVRTTRPAARRFGNKTRHLNEAANLPARGTLRFLVAWPENASCNVGEASYDRK